MSKKPEPQMLWVVDERQWRVLQLPCTPTRLSGVKCWQTHFPGREYDSLETRVFETRLDALREMTRQLEDEISTLKSYLTVAEDQINDIEVEMEIDADNKQE